MKWQIVCTGIGGRGVLLASALLIETAEAAGYHAMGSDELGMSQRGGSVISMITIGDFKSPFVGRENADILLSFEESEFYRNLVFLKRDGIAVVNTARHTLPDTVRGLLDARGTRCFFIDADAMSWKRKMPQASNMAMLGFFSGLNVGPYSFDALTEALRRKVPQKVLTTNLEVMGDGRKEAETQLQGVTR